RLHALDNQGQFQLGREAPPTADAGDHFDFRERIGHRHMPRLIPRPSGLAPVSGRNRVHSTQIYDPCNGADEKSIERCTNVRIANYTFWLAAFTALLVAVSSVQIWFLIRS